jgi:O-antigen/teichoic acid export membrane protein
MTVAHTYRSRVARDGPALVAASGVTAAFSLGFWAAAARLHDTATLGRASTEIAAIALVGGFAQLNLQTVLLRFLPAAGRSARRLLLGSYAAILLASVIGGCVVVGFGLVAGLGGIGSLGWAVCVGAVTAQAVFYVQDGVLTALGQVSWVPAIKLFTTLLRFAVLVLPIAAAERFAIAGAWFVPVFGAVLVVNVLVLRRLSDAPQTGAGDRCSLPPRRELARFIGAEYVNSLVINLVTFGPPLLILRLLGATAAAYFNLPWLIVTTMQALLWNAVMPFIVESVRTPTAARSIARQTVAVGGALVAAGTMVLLLAAPLVLGVEGDGFAEAGSPLLRTLAVSIPFTAVMVLYSAIALIRRAIWPLVAINTLSAVVLFGGLVAVLSRFGIVGAGVVYVVMQAVLAVLAAPFTYRWFRTAMVSTTTVSADDTDSPSVASARASDVATLTHRLLLLHRRVSSAVNMCMRRSSGDRSESRFGRLGAAAGRLGASALSSTRVGRHPVPRRVARPGGRTRQAGVPAPRS